jgi:hypothetical protein
MKYAMTMFALVFAACATTTDDAGWEDWGGFTLANSEIAVHHRVKEGRHRLELLRRLGDNGDGTLRWDTLDVVPLDLEPNTLVCLSATRENGTGDFVAVAEDDSEHRHRVLRAWRIDTARRKLVTAEATGLVCNAKAEPRTH